MNLPLGTQIGPYTLTREIARGGQGAVFEARSPGGESVALKLLLDDEEEARVRFLREAETLARLSHPNLIRVLDLGQTPGGIAYLALELVRGQSFSDWVRGAGPPSVDEVRRVMKSAGEALHYCHEQGLVHRDLKPQNLLLESETGRVVVVDFGLVRRNKLALAWSTQDRASLTQEGAVLGTPPYMPPEQISPEFGHVDRRSDIYGLGATLYFLLTGEAPFKAPGVLQLLTQVVSDPAPDPRAARSSVPSALAELCSRSLAKDPDERPSTGLEFAEALVGGRSPRSKTTGVGALVLGALAVLGLGVAGQMATRSPSPRPVTPTPQDAPDDTAALRPPASGDPTQKALARAAKLLKGDANEQRRGASSLARLARKGSSLASFRLGLYSAERSRKGEAARWFREAAEGGHAGAMVNLGILYEEGIGEIQNPAQARIWFLRAAEAKHVGGMFHLGRLLLEGIGGEPALSQGIEWLKGAADGGQADAMVLLGTCALEGKGMPQSDSEAARLYMSAADSGDSEGLARLAGLYREGQGVPKDLDRATKLYRQAAELGEALAFLPYGEALLRGEGTAQDLPGALKWFRKSAKRGHKVAAGRAGLLLLNGGPGLKADPRRGIALLEQAAMENHPESMFELGRALLQGKKTKQNEAEGARGSSAPLSWVTETPCSSTTACSCAKTALLRPQPPQSGWSAQQKPGTRGPWSSGGESSAPEATALARSCG